MGAWLHKTCIGGFILSKLVQSTRSIVMPRATARCRAGSRRGEHGADIGGYIQ